MNPLHCFALTCLLVFSLVSTAQAKTWIADSNPNHAADFRTAQEAHDGAEEGDVIYLVGSFRHYGDLVVTKRLTFIGPGYFLDENYPTFRNVFPARLKKVSLTYEISNSEFDNVNPEDITSDSTGTILQGVTIEGELHILASDIVVKGCHVKNLRLSHESFGVIPAGGTDKRDYISACLFVQSYFEESHFIQVGCSEIVFKNNVFSTGIFYSGSGNGGSPITSVELTNNVFDKIGLTTYDNRFQNNIFGEVSQFKGTRFSATGNVFNSNKWNTSSAGDSLDESTNTSFFEDAYLALFDGSGSDGQYLPAIGNADLLNGDDGAMVGPFGGSYPYVLSGLPNIPRIVGVDAPPTGPSNGSIPITLKVRLPQ